MNKKILIADKKWLFFESALDVLMYNKKRSNSSKTFTVKELKNIIEKMKESKQYKEFRNYEFSVQEIGQNLIEESRVKIVSSKEGHKIYLLIDECPEVDNRLIESGIVPVARNHLGRIALQKVIKEGNKQKKQHCVSAFHITQNTLMKRYQIVINEIYKKIDVLTTTIEPDELEEVYSKLLALIEQLKPINPKNSKETNIVNKTKSIFLKEVKLKYKERHTIISQIEK